MTLRNGWNSNISRRCSTNYSSQKAEIRINKQRILMDSHTITMYKTRLTSFPIYHDIFCIFLSWNLVLVESFHVVGIWNRVKRVKLKIIEFSCIITKSIFEKFSDLIDMVEVWRAIVYSSNNIEILWPSSLDKWRIFRINSRDFFDFYHLTASPLATSSSWMICNHRMEWTINCHRRLTVNKALKVLSRSYQSVKTIKFQNLFEFEVSWQDASPTGDFITMKNY